MSLQYYCVDFSWVNLGKRSEQSLWIENKSDCTAHFQFDIDCQESVFSIRPAFGTLVGKSRLTLHCAFQPTHPIIYFRRVACFIHHQVSYGGGGEEGLPGKLEGPIRVLAMKTVLGAQSPVFWSFQGCLPGSSPPEPQSGFWSQSLARGM